MNTKEKHSEDDSATVREIVACAREQFLEADDARREEIVGALFEILLVAAIGEKDAIRCAKKLIAMHGHHFEKPTVALFCSKSTWQTQIAMVEWQDACDALNSPAPPEVPLTGETIRVTYDFSQFDMYRGVAVLARGNGGLQ